MEKKQTKIYLTEDSLRKLRLKAEGMGFDGRGWLSRFLNKIAITPLVLLDENVRGLLNALQLNKAIK